MVYADPYKLEAHQLSLMDVVRSVNDANLILPAGDVQIGPLDYNIYTNSQLRTVARDQPASAQDRGPDPGARRRYRLRRGRAADPDQHRPRGWTALRLHPHLKQGGDTNTIAVVDGIKYSAHAPVRCAQEPDHRTWSSINPSS